MKILHLTTSLSWRGGEQQLAYLLEELSKRPDVSQLVLCPRGSAVQDFCERHDIRHELFEGKNRVRMAFALKRLVKKEAIQLVHAHDGHAAGISAWAAFWGMRTPQVLHRRVIFPLKNNPVSRYKYNHASVQRILCVSEAVRQALLPSLQQPEKAEVVYSCIDLRRFAEIEGDAGSKARACEMEAGSSVTGRKGAAATDEAAISSDAAASRAYVAAESSEATASSDAAISSDAADESNDKACVAKTELVSSLRQRFALPDDAFVVGNVAALTREKDYFTFLQVAAEVCPVCPQARFVIIGDGVLRADLERQVRLLHLEHKVFFAGFQREIPFLLKQLDLFLTTTRSEGLGTSVLDAFAAGVPVVATATGGIPELVTSGESGLLAPVGDAKKLAEAVLRIYKDAWLRERLQSGARRKVSEFAVSRMGERIYHIYHAVLQDNKDSSFTSGSASSSFTSGAAPRLSLIIAFYNNIACLRLIYASLRCQTFRDFEVIIADDGSNREVVEALHALNAAQPFLVTHCWQEDIGWRKNRILNEAVRKSRSDYLVFIDGDCLLERHFLEDHFQFRQAGGMISGRRVMLSEACSRDITEQAIEQGALQQLFVRLLRSWENRSTWKYALRIGSPFWRRLLVHDTYRPIKGCNFSIHKSDLLRVNGFDERYQARGTGEDDDLEARLSRIGVLPRTCRHAVVQYHYWHPHKESFSLENKRLKRENDENGISYTPYGIQK